MIPSWAYLDEQERSVFRAAIAFLDGRLTDPSTIEWALRLGPDRRIERIAIENLLSSPNARITEEPWGTAWRLIEESWFEKPLEKGPSTEIYGIQARLRAGDRSGAIVSAIVSLVAPRLKVESIKSWRSQFIKKPRRPKTFQHLMSAGLSSGELVDLNVLELEKLSDQPFLSALANALESAVDRGLDIGRRIGWDGQSRLWQLGGLDRVYYVVPNRRGPDGKEDPDAYRHGIAPAIKLLYAVVARIANLSPQKALPLVQRWRLLNTAIHTRLWAAAARNSQLVSATEVTEFLLALDDTQFWNLHVFPEIAELRASRYGGLDQKTQEVLAIRLRKGPPRSFWPKKTDAKKVRSGRLYWAVRELKRIELQGGDLPADAKSWLESQIGHFADLVDMSTDEGLSEGLTVRDVLPNPDDRYDALEGVTRLRALETALGSSRSGRNDDPAERADDWLRQPANTAHVLNDLEAADHSGDDFPRLWNRFGWAHFPTQSETPGTPQRDLQHEADRVLALLGQLSEKTLSTAIEGVSNWLDFWRKQVVASPSGLSVWSRLWPIATEATNVKQENEGDADLSVTARAADDDREPMDLDTLNTPAGKLVGVFLAACPSLEQMPNPFVIGTAPRQMRDALIAANGRSGLIARHRLIEVLPYFLRADRAWTEHNLITPLLNDDGASLALWRAIARRTHFTEVLKIIGGAMAERATDLRLGRETRQRLVFSLVVEALHAFRESREPAVPNPRIQQMLRTLDDEVRASAANAVQQFVRELSKQPPNDQYATSAAELFRSAAAPFLRNVWPQERSLATPGVSKALADLPAVSGEAFVEAVAVIERFLVPFECWSMLDYGLFGDEGDAKKLSIIDNEAHAKALLRLLDLTVGPSDGAVIPYDLTDALDQIRSVAPHLVESPTYRRLSTAARR
jgi:hypothetical protein